MKTEYGICPVCNGTGERPLSEREKNYSWNKGKETGKCCNCGGQYMYSTPTGKVPLDKNGTPCYHNYKHETIGRCWHQYTCLNCGDRYEIDSGD